MPLVLGISKGTSYGIGLTHLAPTPRLRIIKFAVVSADGKIHFSMSDYSSDTMKMSERTGAVDWTILPSLGELGVVV